MNETQAIKLAVNHFSISDYDSVEVTKRQERDCTYGLYLEGYSIAIRIGEKSYRCYVNATTGNIGSY